MASDYFTTTPEMKAPVEVAAAAGSYGSFQVPAHGSVMPVQVEGSVVQYQQKVRDVVMLDWVDTLKFVVFSFLACMDCVIECCEL